MPEVSEARLAIVQDEFDSIIFRFEHAYSWLVELMRDSARDSHHRDCAELALRLLVLRDHVFWDVFGVSAEHGYRQALAVTSPIERLEFVKFFVGHELLDDGDPALAWCTVDLDNDGRYPQYKLCKEDEHRAKPYFHSCQEVTAEKWEDRAPHLRPDKALWALDWHEKYWEERYARHREQYGNTEEQPKGNAKLIALAAELRALMEAK